MDKKVIYTVTYSSFCCSDNYHHVETEICLTEKEAVKHYDNSINTIREDFNEHGYDTSWFKDYKFPNFISEFCEDNETSYIVKVEEKEICL